MYNSEGTFRTAKHRPRDYLSALIFRVVHISLRYLQLPVGKGISSIGSSTIIKIVSIFNTFSAELNTSASPTHAAINQKQEQEAHFNIIFIKWSVGLTGYPVKLL